MSSFVISKSEYIKAAGFCSAAAATLNYYREPVLRVWNKKHNRVSTAEDIRADFTRLYEINLAAVNAQYGDDFPSDTAEYMGDFYAVQTNAKNFFSRHDNPENLRRLMTTAYGLIQFFDCVQYQIEGDEYTRRALNILNKYYRALHKLTMYLSTVTSEDVSDYWGNFQISE
jgi:hypothetical protein